MVVLNETTFVSVIMLMCFAGFWLEMMNDFWIFKFWFVPSPLYVVTFGTEFSRVHVVD